MYTGTLAAVSNRQDWQFNIELIDNDTGDVVDLTGAVINLAVRSQDTNATRLTGSTTSGHITIAQPATSAEVAFAPSDMSALCAGSYDIGITVMLSSGVTFQLLAGTLPVIDGVVCP